MRFTFIGTFNLDLSDSKAYKKGVTKTGSDYLSINPTIVEKQNNRMRCEMFGMKSNIIKTSNQNGEKIDISWGDRKDSDVIKDVADYRKNFIVVGNERNEFISTYDAIEYIAENLTNLNGKRVRVTGSTNKDFYQGKARDRFTINNITVISDDDERKNNLNGRVVLYWDKSCIDAADFKSDKKLYINGFTSEYISDLKENRYVNTQLVFDCSKADFENEKHMKQIRLKLMQMGLDYKDGKIVNNMKAKGYAVNEFSVHIVNGAEEVEFSIDDCTDVQKMYIEAGLNTLDDFRPRGNLFGQWITEYKIQGPTLTGNYTDGMSYIEDKPSEFEDMIYVPLMDEKADEALPFEEIMPAPIEEDENEDDLFG